MSERSDRNEWASKWNAASDQVQVALYTHDCRNKPNVGGGKLQVAQELDLLVTESRFNAIVATTVCARILKYYLSIERNFLFVINSSAICLHHCISFSINDHAVFIQLSWLIYSVFSWLIYSVLSRLNKCFMYSLNPSNHNYQHYQFIHLFIHSFINWYPTFNFGAS